MADKDKFEQWLEEMTRVYKDLETNCVNDQLRDNCDTCLGLLELVKDAYKRKEKL